MMMSMAEKKLTGFALANQIVDEVADNCGVTSAMLRGRRRSRTVSRARHEAMRRVRIETDLSLSEMAEVFDRDDSTIHGVVRRCE